MLQAECENRLERLKWKLIGKNVSVTEKRKA